MKNVLIFGGTAEGRNIAEFLGRQEQKVHICVATEYGKDLLDENEWIKIHPGRLEREEMKALIEEIKADFIIDATHPYAVQVTENISAVCREVEKEYCRLVRRESRKFSECVYKENMEAAVEYLEGTTGNILLTTGSKDLPEWSRLEGAGERIFPRILPSPDMINKAAGLGFPMKNLICMQGPFSEEMNLALIRQKEIKWLVTKESGNTGGFEEKINSAVRAGISVVVIGRPLKEEGIQMEDLKERLIEELDLAVTSNIIIAGIGPGSRASMTYEVEEACKKADLLIGAKRMTDAFSHVDKPVWNSYKPEEIGAYIRTHRYYENIAVLMSGDTGFYSGCKKLSEELKGEKVQILPGISSVAYLCSRLGISWEDARIISLHGKEENIIAEVKQNKKVLLLSDTGKTVSFLCREFLSFGMAHVRVTVGENLSYEEERILRGTPGEMLEETFTGLCVICIENADACEVSLFSGIEDDKFLRGKVPMTKEEIRRTAIGKLRLKKNSVIYDVGAGTGSVSVEAALTATAGKVYAVEYKEEAAALLHDNKKRFQVSNMEIICGTAPEALEELEPPTHVFIGGTKGNLKEVITCALEKNKCTRFVVTAITLETVSQALQCLKELNITEEEIVCMNVSKSDRIGGYHMMKAHNPVYIISFTGEKK